MADYDLDGVVNAGKSYARDLAERVVTTFVEAFAAGVVLTAPLDVEMWHAAALGGVAAVGALLKGLVAKAVGRTDSASLSRSV